MNQQIKLTTLLIFITGLQSLCAQPQEATHPLRQQRNLIRKQKALEFLNSHLGEDFVDRFLVYSEEQPDTKPGVSFDIKNKPNKDGRNMLIVYTTVTSQDSFSYIEVDTTITAFPASTELQKCFSGEGDCSFLFLDFETAIRLVEKDCAYLGPKYTDRLVVDNTNGSVKWIFTIFDTPDTGEIVNVDAKTGACDKVTFHN